MPRPDPASSVGLGALDHGAVAGVDPLGVVRAGGLTLDWWVGADDRWRVGGDDGAIQSRAGAAPVIETAVRIPGGEAVQRAYALGGGKPLVVVEVENHSPAAFALAWVLRVERGAVSIDDRIVKVDGQAVLVLPRPSTHWAAAPPGASTRPAVMSGQAREGSAAPGEIEGVGELALLFPVPHRTVLRVALAPAGADNDVDLARLPDASAVRRGWAHQLDHGLRTELPDPLQWCVGVARADALIEAASATRTDPDVAAALEDWGLDAEALAAWARLGLRGRRQARRRPPRNEPWAYVRDVVSGSIDAVTVPGGAAVFLLALRHVLVHERGDAIDLLPHFPPDWLGQDLAVHGVPLRGGGTLGFAVRWHGPRPALLWDAPARCTLRASELDATWSAAGGAGEALLAEPPSRLLSLGQFTTRAGERLQNPGSFT